jgi:hypothetical protein
MEGTEEAQGKMKKTRPPRGGGAPGSFSHLRPFEPHPLPRSRGAIL